MYGNFCCNLCSVCCCLWAISYGPWSPLLSLSENHCAENNNISESCSAFLLSPFICLEVVSHQTKICFSRQKLLAWATKNARQAASSGQAPVGGKPLVRNPGCYCWERQRKGSSSCNLCFVSLPFRIKVASSTETRRFLHFWPIHWFQNTIPDSVFVLELLRSTFRNSTLRGGKIKSWWLKICRLQ